MRALARRGVSSAEIRTFGSRTTRGTLPPARCVGLGDGVVHRLLLAQFVSKRLVAIQVAFVRKRHANRRFSLVKVAGWPQFA